MSMELARLGPLIMFDGAYLLTTTVAPELFHTTCVIQTDPSLAQTVFMAIVLFIVP